MKIKISTKIFAVLISSFIVLLFLSMVVNIETQKNLYLSNVQKSYRYSEIVDKVNNLFEKYGIAEDKTYSDEQILEVIYSSDFKDEFYKIASENSAFLYITKFDRINEVYLSSLEIPYKDNYIKLGNDEIIFIGDLLNENQRSELLEILKAGLYPNDVNDLTHLEISYAKSGDELVYFSYTLSEEAKQLLLDKDVKHHVEFKKNDYAGEIKTSYITKFYIDGYCTAFDMLNSKHSLFKAEDIKQFVEDNRTFSGSRGNSLYYRRDVRDITYLFMNATINRDDSLFFLNIADMANDADAYTLKWYLQSNYHIYIIAFVLALIIARISSYMISKPIKKLEQSALKISNNQFDEEVTTKSQDEIGSLANSIEIMRLNLIEHINKLNDEVEKVKELESLRKDFINQFTHEMKTPLGIINGYSELIEEAETDEEKQKYLDIINRETVRINDLVQAMLKLSRLESGKVELSKEQLDLEDIASEVIDEFEVLLMKKNIKVEVHVVDKYVYGDKQQLMTVIRNFISNAIKHTDTKIILTIDKGIKVFNEGKPIDEDKLNGIWYTFVTHDKTGTGLGLAICRSILELHNYQYGVTNKENGVEFYFFE